MQHTKRTLTHRMTFADWATKWSPLTTRTRRHEKTRAPDHGGGRTRNRRYPPRERGLGRECCRQGGWYSSGCRAEKSSWASERQTRSTRRRDSLVWSTVTYVSTAEPWCAITDRHQETDAQADKGNDDDKLNDVLDWDKDDHGARYKLVPDPNGTYESIGNGLYKSVEGNRTYRRAGKTGKDSSLKIERAWQSRYSGLTSYPTCNRGPWSRNYLSSGCCNIDESQDILDGLYNGSYCFNQTHSERTSRSRPSVQRSKLPQPMVRCVFQCRIRGFDSFGEQLLIIFGLTSR